ncbi:MAG: hypothetical protein WCG02_03625 [Candidatus Taylorbacteria bacterium]
MNVNRQWVLTQCPKSLIEGISLHSVLLNLGFSLNDEVYVTISERDVVVILRSQGREVSFRAGGGECDSQKMAMFWQRLISQWNTGGSLSETDRDEIYRCLR